MWLLYFAFTITHTIPRFPPEPELHGGRKVPLEIQGLLVKRDAAVCVIRQNPDRPLRAGAPVPTSPQPRASPPKGTKHPGTLAGLSFPFPPRALGGIFRAPGHSETPLRPRASCKLETWGPVKRNLNCKPGQLMLILTARVRHWTMPLAQGYNL